MLLGPFQVIKYSTDFRSSRTLPCWNKQPVNKQMVEFMNKYEFQELSPPVNDKIQDIYKQ